jgi:hypothetical protein
MEASAPGGYGRRLRYRSNTEAFEALMLSNYLVESLDDAVARLESQLTWWLPAPYAHLAPQDEPRERGSGHAR